MWCQNRTVKNRLCKQRSIQKKNDLADKLVDNSRSIVVLVVLRWKIFFLLAFAVEYGTTYATKQQYYFVRCSYSRCWHFCPKKLDTTGSGCCCFWSFKTWSQWLIEKKHPHLGKTNRSQKVGCVQVSIKMKVICSCWFPNNSKWFHYCERHSDRKLLHKKFNCNFQTFNVKPKWIACTSCIRTTDKSNYGYIHTHRHTHTHAQLGPAYTYSYNQQKGQSNPLARTPSLSTVTVWRVGEGACACNFRWRLFQSFCYKILINWFHSTGLNWFFLPCTKNRLQRAT